jgi:hypothetical protein
MDKISDFFFDLRDRATNPLFSSFIIAWLVYNWQIPIGLIFYKGSELSAVGYKSYFELISNNLGLWNSFCVPLLYAVGYTFLFPPIRLLIMAFMTWVKTKSTNWNLKIRKTGFVHVTKYIEVIKKYEDQTLFLAELIKDESTTQDENIRLKTAANGVQEQVRQLLHDKSEIERKINEEKQKLEIELREVKKISNIDWLNGDWLIIRKNKNSKGEFIDNDDRIFIKDGEVFEFDFNQQKKRIYTILNYFYNQKSKEIFFINKPYPNGDILYHRLSYGDNKQLIGQENEVIDIKYERTDKSNLW